MLKSKRIKSHRYYMKLLPAAWYTPSTGSYLVNADLNFLPIQSSNMTFYIVECIPFTFFEISNEIPIGQGLDSWMAKLLISVHCMLQSIQAFFSGVFLTFSQSVAFFTMLIVPAISPHKQNLSLDTVRVIILRRNLARLLSTHRKFVTLLTECKNGRKQIILLSLC